MTIFSTRTKIILFILLILTGAGIYIKTQKTKNHDQTTIAVKKGSIIKAVYGIGTVTAKKTFQVKVGIASTLIEIYVKEGDFVREGTPLMKLDTVITAPFSGTVTAIPFKVGETVFPQVPLLTLTDLSDSYIVVSLEQEASLQVRKGQRAILNFESLRKQKFEGKVTAIFSNEGQFWVHIRGISLPETILPGMTADVAIELEHKNNCLIIPVTAILAPPSQDNKSQEATSEKKVKVLESGKVIEKVIQLGTVDADTAEVISGLQEGDRLLIKE